MGDAETGRLDESAADTPQHHLPRALRTLHIGHVGFYLGDKRFIHSLGLVKIGSFDAKDPLYDAFNTGRYLFGGRVLPYVNQDPDLTTTLTNPFYAE